MNVDYSSFGLQDPIANLVGAALPVHLSDMVVGHVLMVDGGWTLH